MVLKGVKTLFKGMTEEDREQSKKVDFEQMFDEMHDHIQKWIDMVDFKKATDKQIALIDATMVTMYSAMQEGDILIEKANPASSEPSIGAED